MKKNQLEKQENAPQEEASIPKPSRHRAWDFVGGGLLGSIASYAGFNHFFPDQSKELNAQIAELNEKLAHCESSSTLTNTVTDISSFCHEIVEKPYDYVESLSQETCNQLFSDIKSNCKTLTDLAAKEIYTGDELRVIHTTANEIAHHLKESKKEVFLKASQKFLDETTHRFANHFCSDVNSPFTNSCIDIVKTTNPQVLANITPYLSSILKADTSTVDGLRSVYHACQAIMPSSPLETTTSSAITTIVQEAKTQFIKANCTSDNILFQNTCSEIVNNTVSNHSFELLESALDPLSIIKNTIPDTAENLLTIKANCSILSNQFSNTHAIQDLLNQVTENAYNQFSNNLCDQNALTLASNACKDIIYATSDQALIKTSALLEKISHLSFTTLADVNQAKEICHTIMTSANSDQTLIAKACQSIINAASEQFAIATCEGISSNFTSACSDIVSNALLSDQAGHILSMLNEIKDKVAQDILSKADVIQIQQQCSSIVDQFSNTTVGTELENACRIIVEEALQKTTYTESILSGINETSEFILYGIDATSESIQCGINATSESIQYGIGVTSESIQCGVDVTSTVATNYLAQPVAKLIGQAISYAVVTPVMYTASAIQSAAGLIKDCSDPQNIAPLGTAVVETVENHPWVTTAVATGALVSTAYLMHKNRASLTSPFRRSSNSQTVDDSRVEHFSPPAPSTSTTPRKP